MKVLGIMSGSSLDGIDFALVEFSGEKTKLRYDIIKTVTITLSQDLIDRLRRSASLSAIEMVILDADYTVEIARLINENFDKDEMDLISLHGHTVFHLPDSGVSMQLGKGGILSSLTRKKVITDFREADIALGGVGTPLVPIVERDLLPGYAYYLNLGGIANISIHSDDKITAFDVCPCNQVLNYLAQKEGHDYDDQGERARIGKLSINLLENLDHNFYHKSPPKSIDNSWIHNEVIPIIDKSGATTENALHTMCHFIGNQIASSLMGPGKILVTGGGVFNNFLIENIRKAILDKEVKVVIPDIELIDYKESILMAYMGYLRIMRQHNIIHSVTGASRSSMGGAIYNSIADNEQ